MYDLAYDLLLRKGQLGPTGSGSLLYHTLRLYGPHNRIVDRIKIDKLALLAIESEPRASPHGTNVSTYFDVGLHRAGPEVKQRFNERIATIYGSD